MKEPKVVIIQTGFKPRELNLDFYDKGGNVWEATASIPIGVLVEVALSEPIGDLYTRVSTFDSWSSLIAQFSPDIVENDRYAVQMDYPKRWKIQFFADDDESVFIIRFNIK